MSLQQQITDAMKTAMKAKDSQSLEALRAVKSAILLAQTESGAKEFNWIEYQISALRVGGSNPPAWAL